MSVEWDFPEEVTESDAFIITDIEQGTDDWLLLRNGKITSSKISDIMAKGDGKTRDKYRIQLAIERITGKPAGNTFKSAAMKRGNEHEPLAREHYEFVNDVDVQQVAFVLHQTLSNAGASPDGLVGDDGLLEIKCPDQSTHIEYLLSKKVPGKYLLQIQWQLACTKRLWCDFMTYSHDLPIHLRAMAIRVHRDEQKINELERAAIQFDNEIETLIKQLGE